MVILRATSILGDKRRTNGKYVELQKKKKKY